jgi:hypothetical protein
MVTTELREIVRDVTDVGIRVRLHIPPSWSEAEADGTILFVGGRLEDNDQTLVPSVQVRVEAAADAQVAQAAVAGVAGVLTEAVVVFEESGEDRSGQPQIVAELAHRSDLTGATQISMFRTVYVDARKVAVSVIATCGGAASESARDALRDVVASMSVELRDGETDAAPPGTGD